MEWRTNIHQGDNRFQRAMLEHIKSKLPDHFTTQPIYQIEVLYDRDFSEWQISRKRVIFNPGTESPELADTLDRAGITHLEACTLVMLQTGQF